MLCSYKIRSCNSTAGFKPGRGTVSRVEFRGRIHRAWHRDWVATGVRTAVALAPIFPCLPGCGNSCSADGRPGVRPGRPQTHSLRGCSGSSHLRFWKHLCPLLLLLHRRPVGRVVFRQHNSGSNSTVAFITTPTGQMHDGIRSLVGFEFSRLIELFEPPTWEPLNVSKLRRGMLLECWDSIN